MFFSEFDSNFEFSTDCRNCMIVKKDRDLFSTNSYNLDLIYTKIKTLVLMFNLSQKMIHENPIIYYFQELD